MYTTPTTAPYADNYTVPAWVLYSLRPSAPQSTLNHESLSPLPRTGRRTTAPVRTPSPLMIGTSSSGMDGMGFKSDKDTTPVALLLCGSVVCSSQSPPHSFPGDTFPSTTPQNGTGRRPLRSRTSPGVHCPSNFNTGCPIAAGSWALNLLPTNFRITQRAAPEVLWPLGL